MQRYRAVPTHGTEIDIAAKAVKDVGGANLLILPHAVTFTFDADEATVDVVRKLSCINAVAESRDIDIVPEKNGRYRGLSQGN